MESVGAYVGSAGFRHGHSGISGVWDGGAQVGILGDAGGVISI